MPVGSSTSNPEDRRAQVIAQFDYIKAELPDVFFVNFDDQGRRHDRQSYPLNFAAAPYPAGQDELLDSFVLPLGNTFGRACRSP